MTIKLIKTDSEFLEAMATVVNGEWYYMPYWFKKVGEYLYETVLVEKLPNIIKQMIPEIEEQIRKVPITYTSKDNLQSGSNVAGDYRFQVGERVELKNVFESSGKRIKGHITAISYVSNDATVNYYDANKGYSEVKTFPLDELISVNVAGGKDWEIVNYILADGRLAHPSRYDHINSSSKIYSVKRLSDGEVFSIGDEVFYNLTGFPKGKIKSFSIDNHRMLVKDSNDYFCGFPIDRIQKVPITQTFYPKDEVLMTVQLSKTEIDKLRKFLNNMPC